MSGKVVVNRSMSLDGFIAGPGHAMDWIFDFVAPDEFPELATATGAMLVGGRTYEVGNRMAAENPSDVGYPFSPEPYLSRPTSRRTRPTHRTHPTRRTRRSPSSRAVGSRHHPSLPRPQAVIGVVLRPASVPRPAPAAP
jgi:RibD C-terminal domain